MKIYPCPENFDTIFECIACSVRLSSFRNSKSGFLVNDFMEGIFLTLRFRFLLAMVITSRVFSTNLQVFAGQQPIANSYLPYSFINLLGNSSLKAITRSN
jgi:hypothetical protein